MYKMITMCQCTLMCVTLIQGTLTHCYLIHVCHNDTMYIDTLLSSYTCVSQWHKVHWHIFIIYVSLVHTCIRWNLCGDVLCVIVTHRYKMITICHCTLCHCDTSCVSQWHKVHWHIVIILYMCVTMTQSTLTHSYHLIPGCPNDTNYIDTLLSC
jgi:hypothetical protein